ncbi:MAG: outer membrane beta-barrel protein [Thermoanaerobaculales bacterium]|jgi:outer membrane protein|nr:outer membrane beta-barrel protein [Thermoanaerobaculales bacterium]
MASRIVSAVLAAALAGGVAAAQTPDWELGGRVLSVHAAASTDEIAGLGAALEVDDGFGLEIDATLLISELFTAEISAAVSRHDLSLVEAGSCCGAADGGEVWILPITLIVRYHLPVYGPWDPYAGLGLTWAAPYYDLEPEIESAGVERLDVEGGVGFAAQIGVGYAIDAHWRANLDLRHLGYSLDVRVRTAEGDLDPVPLDLEPWVFSLGLGYRF